MKRSGQSTWNDSSIASLRSYTMMTFLCILFLLISVLVVDIMTNRNTVDELHRAAAAGRRMDLIAHASLTLAERRLLVNHPWFGDLGIPLLNGPDVVDHLISDKDEIWYYHESLLLGDDDIKPTYDPVNEQLMNTPTLMVTAFEPSVLTLHSAVNHYVDSLDLISKASDFDFHEALLGNYTSGTLVSRETIASKNDFVIENGHYGILDGAGESLEGIVTGASDTMLITEYITVMAVAAVVVLLVVVGILVFKQSLVNVC